MGNQLACRGRNSRGSVDFMIYICPIIELTSRGVLPWWRAERQMVTLIGGAILYLALLGMAAGVVSLVIPLRFLGIRARKRGLIVFGLGLLAFTVGVYLPVTETRVETPRTRLDEF